MEILVLGSFMMDLVVKTSRAPESGETIIGTSFAMFPGGKGANQAVAAARLGGKVMMAGKVRTDQFGDEALMTLNNENINTQFMLRDHEFSTGVGSIVLEENGDNRIIVAPGANLNYSFLDLNTIKDVIKDSKILVTQLEMDYEVTRQAILFAASNNIPVILNPAPACNLDDELFKNVTYLTPNETEAELLTGIKISSFEEAEAAAKVLLEKGVKNVVMTLAEKGSLIADESGVRYMKGFSVKAIDTVAAGDSFNGALAFGITNGKSLDEAVKMANAVGALAVTKEGAIPSLPYLEEVEQFIQSQRSVLA